MLSGFNKENVLQLSDGRKRPEGSPDLRTKLEYNLDLGIEATVNSGGWVFNLQNYLQGDAKQQKQYSLTLAAAVADQLKRTEQKLECVCLLKYSLVPSEVCRIADKTVLPPVVSFNFINSLKGSPQGSPLYLIQHKMFYS